MTSLGFLRRQQQLYSSHSVLVHSFHSLLNLCSRVFTPLRFVLMQMPTNMKHCIQRGQKILFHDVLVQKPVASELSDTFNAVYLHFSASLYACLFSSHPEAGEVAINYSLTAPQHWRQPSSFTHASTDRQGGQAGADLLEKGEAEGFPSHPMAQNRD